MGKCYSVKNIEDEEKRVKRNLTLTQESRRTQSLTSRSNTYRTSRTTKYSSGEEQFYQVPSDQIVEESEYKDKVEICLSLIGMCDEASEYKVKVSLCNMKNGNKIFETIGETETVSPEELKITFNRTFFLIFYFEIKQLLLFEFFKNGHSRGCAEVPFGWIFSSRNKVNQIKHRIDDDHSDTFLEVHINEKVSSTSLSTLKLKFVMDEDYEDNRQYNLFYYIEAKKDKKQWRLVYKSNDISVEKDREIIEPKVIPTEILTTNDSNQIQITFCHSRSKDILGQYVYVVSRSNASSSLHKPQKRLTETRVKSFSLDYQEDNRMTFSEYITQGLDINLIIGIDYTSSNGLPENPTSLHYLDPEGTMNDYENAIISCGQIVAQYDYDKLYPVYGFGGKLKNSKTASHCFPITYKNDPNIGGIENIPPVYRMSFGNIELAGPTLFTPLINEVAKQIEEEKNSEVSKYYILMILTDGLITDMNTVRDLIVKASTWPLSIIIIGIGNGDFWNMKELDGNDVLLTNQNGTLRKRDLVRFVKFNKYKNKDNPHELNQSLAKEVLKEVPSQVEEYFRISNIPFRPEKKNSSNNNTFKALA